MLIYFIAISLLVSTPDRDLGAVRAYYLVLVGEVTAKTSSGRYAAIKVRLDNSLKPLRAATRP